MFGVTNVFDGINGLNVIFINGFMGTAGVCTGAGAGAGVCTVAGAAGAAGVAGAGVKL